MPNLILTTHIPPTTEPCPSWCTVFDHAGEVDDVAGTRYQDHRADPAVLICASPDDPHRLRHTVTVHLDRFDQPGRPGLPAIAIGGLDSEDHMRLTDAEALARLLLTVVARARAERGSYQAEPGGVGVIECVGCGHDFHPDSSPHLDRCWSCAERVDAETDR